MVRYIGKQAEGTQLSAYYHDTYEDQAETRVLAVGSHEDSPWVAVEHCLFHPQGGGQPADRGWVDDHEIVPVRDSQSGLIVATAAGPEPLPAFAPGQQVRTRIDLGARLRHAALHTAGHLVDAAGRAQGWDQVASNHFPGQARIEFTTHEADSRLESPEGREEATEALRVAVAKAIAEDLPVTWRYGDDGLRIVDLAGLHSAPCGGTHVPRLGELTAVTLPALKVKKGRIRVSYDASHRERT